MLLFFISTVFCFVASIRARGFDIPVQRRQVSTRNFRRENSNPTGASGSVGLGDNADVLYTVPIELGETVTAVNLDTGSSDFWVITDACQTGTCNNATVARYPSSQAKPTGTNLTFLYGDSHTGTSASGAVGLDSASVATIAMADQPFGLIDSTNNSIVQFQAAGIFGLGFPGASQIQKNRVQDQLGSLEPTDDFILATSAYGPLIARMAMTGQLEEPMFSVTLQRSTVDISGSGQLTIGKLPDGVDNSSLTWVPVRLYSAQDGGLAAPTFAPDEVYPLRWEIDIDSVSIDGKGIKDSTIPPNGVNPGRVTALIDTGNSLIRGPQDMVDDILETVSPDQDLSGSDAEPLIIPCNVAHTLSFQIGGNMFPVDPRDFIQLRDPASCTAGLVSTDPPSNGSLFRWSLGDPFMKSNLVAFYYGNLTHPSADPPRIGFLSTVPEDADDLLSQAVQEANNNGGAFEQTIELAPTGSAASQPQVTLTAVTRSFSTAKVSSPNAASISARPLQVIDSCALLVLLSTFSWLF